MWVLGMDAGGTKAHCQIAGDNGVIIGQGFGGPSNYQTVGAENAKKELRTAIEEALGHAELKISDISMAVFGMSGADEEIDFQILRPMVKELMGDVPAKILHDSWIGMKTAVEDMVGIVSICGTGAGHSGRNREGKQLTLRNLDFELGNLGGGSDLVSKALHYAFRSNESTFKKTILEEKIPMIFGVSDMEEVCRKIRIHGIDREERYRIPVMVFDAADEGDEVSKLLLENMGYEEGLYGGGVASRLGMKEEKFPVVLIGGLFQTGNSILINSYMKAIHQTAPGAYPVIPDKPPVAGAIGLALDLLKNNGEEL